MSKVKLIFLMLLPFWLFFVSGASYGRYAAIMIDADNGNVLHEIDATQTWYPASLTKVMTLYMTFDALNTGRLHLYDTLTTSYHASRQPNSKLGLRYGESLTVEDAILAVITRSANDAAVVLAEHLGSTEEAFAAMMTAKARSIGMPSTRFVNATGLPDERQVTTSRDMAVMAMNIKRNFPNYYPYFSSHSFYYKGRELRGINKFTAHYPGAEGMKTGYTCGSGFNLIGTAHQNGKNLIGVVLGGMSSAERYQLMTDMMDNGFNNRYVADSGRKINTMPSSFSGEAPYQLNCGKGARNTIASYKKQGNSHTGQRKFAGKAKGYKKRSHLARSKGAKSTRLSKAKKITRSKLASRSKNYKKGSHLARNKGAKSTRLSKIKKASRSVKMASKQNKSSSTKKRVNKAKLTAKAKTTSNGKSVRVSDGNSDIKLKNSKSKRYHHTS